MKKVLVGQIEFQYHGLQEAFEELIADLPASLAMSSSLDIGLWLGTWKYPKFLGSTLYARLPIQAHWVEEKNVDILKQLIQNDVVAYIKGDPRLTAMVTKTSVSLK